MAATEWAWAALNEDELRAIAQAEASLGADYLLAYQPLAADGTPAELPALPAAQLDASQLECLHGLEQQLHAVVVAYAAAT